MFGFFFGVDWVDWFGWVLECWIFIVYFDLGEDGGEWYFEW